MSPAPHTGRGYRLVSQTDEQAEFQFEGLFQGRRVTWQTTLLTLRARWRALLAQGEVRPQTPCYLRPFIEVEPHTAASARPRVTVALDVGRVDHATIAKTIVMLQNYKRLQPGRKEFGDHRRFP